VSVVLLLYTQQYEKLHCQLLEVTFRAGLLLYRREPRDVCSRTDNLPTFLLEKYVIVSNIYWIFSILLTSMA